MIKFIRFLIDKFADNNSVLWIAAISSTLVYFGYFLIFKNDSDFIFYLIFGFLFIPILMLVVKLFLFILSKLLSTIFYFSLKHLKRKESEEYMNKWEEEQQLELNKLLKDSENKAILKYLDESKYDNNIKLKFIKLVRQLRIDREKMNYFELIEKHKNSGSDWVFDFEIKPFFIKRYETAGRYEEAAQICESMGMHEEAGRLRKLTRTDYVKISSVNINQLIPQLKELVNYKCPNCGSGISINSKTSPEGLKFCAHCGSALNLSLISDYIQKLL